MENNIIEVKGLKKKFNDTIAVDNIDFAVKKGEIYGFLGPNGAGKTTTINILTGLTRPDSGFIKFNGLDGIENIKKVQAVIGIVPDESNLYDEMNGFDNLCFCASLYGIDKRIRQKRAMALLDEVGLSDAGNKLFKQYSKGMKRKLTIAAGLIHKPEILFLDEPTTGIDVESARHIRKMILNMNQNNTTIFLTTHYIEEAERLCDRIGFIVSGRIIRTGHLEELMSEIQGENIMQFKIDSQSNNISDIKKDLIDKFQKYRITFHNGTVFSFHSMDRIELFEIVKFLEDNNITVLEAKLMRPSLEEVFVNVTGIGLDRMRKEKEGRKRK